MTFTLIPLIAVITAGLIHEGGHYLAALFLTGKKLKFHFALGWFWSGKLPVPRFIWTMPWTPDKWRRQVIALSGFGLELLVAVAMMIANPAGTFSRVYTLCALLHLVLYRFYAGEASDFKWLT